MAALSPYSSSTLTLTTTDSAVRIARMHVRDVLRTWRVPEAGIDDAVLVASELVTNAVRHAAPTPANPEPRTCTLFAGVTREFIVVAVSDGDPTPPVVRPQTIDATQGRGLKLVSQLSLARGCQLLGPALGKTVWAHVPFAGTPVPPDEQPSALYQPLFAARPED
ncbi:ATP-binding protein [Streptomyces sviceus]|uniref:ATP-binding protein n=1 Tax=Streptomyces sviceus TaxID=285530 RepID=UPI00332F4562